MLMLTVTDIETDETAIIIVIRIR